MALNQTQCKFHFRHSAFFNNCVLKGKRRKITGGISYLFICYLNFEKNAYVNILQQHAQPIMNLRHGPVPTYCNEAIPLANWTWPCRELKACVGSFMNDSAITLLINFKIVTSAPYKHDAITLLFTIVWHNRVAISYVTSSQNLYSPLPTVTWICNLLLTGRNWHIILRARNQYFNCKSGSVKTVSALRNELMTTFRLPQATPRNASKYIRPPENIFFVGCCAE
jgi:hypothetical protein